MCSIYKKGHFTYMCKRSTTLDAHYQILSFKRDPIETGWN